MNSKEQREIKKLYKKVADTTITNMAGCYVSADKNIISTFKTKFFSLADEEAHKYLEIFKKGLSGKIGHVQLNIDFNLDDEKDGNCQNQLLKLRDSELKHDDRLDEFYKKLIDRFDYAGNYLILLAENYYDAPTKASDGAILEDSSETYHYIQCCICPVELTKEGLSYKPQEKQFSKIEREWAVKPPIEGFVFPNFVDRSTDLHSTMIFSKKSGLERTSFIEAITEKVSIESIEDECNTIVSAFSDLEEKDKLENIKNIYSEIVTRCETDADQTFDKHDFKNILEDNGFDKEKAEETINAIQGDVTHPQEIFSPKAEIISGETSIKTSAVNVSQLEVKIVDGKRSIVIPTDGPLIINGIEV